MEVQRIGDLAGVAGVLISIVGFAVTLRGVFKSKRAAQAAEEAARSARDRIQLLDTVVDFSAAIATLDEIKRLHRTGKWSLLPDRYSALRRLLTVVRTANPNLLDSQQAVLQNAVTNLYQLEKLVEQGAKSPALKPAEFNAILSRDADNLSAILQELKTSAKTGG
jgi:hypothetical protein